MEEKLSRILTEFLISQGIGKSELFQIYMYGFELIISFLFSLSLIILIGILMRKIIVTFVFLIIFILLRRFTGGYHAPSFVLCQITTILTYLIVMEASYLFTINLYEYLILYIFGSILILKYAPIVNIKKPLSPRKRKKNRINGFCSFSILCFIGCVLSTQILESTITNALFFSTCSVVILMIISILKGGIRNAEKN